MRSLLLDQQAGGCHKGTDQMRHAEHRMVTGSTFGLTVILCGLLFLAGCFKAPGTARNQLIFLSEEKELAMGASTFREVLKNARLSANPEISEMVNRVGHRIASVVNRPQYHWEFAVIDNDAMVNAFALPGGKVAIYTGILKHTKNEAGLATVIAHEVAHALQRHGAERVSRGVIDTIARLGVIAGAATGAVNSELAATAINAYGVSVTLPHSRRQESEADYIGLQLMAKAGYDPREAVGFWERMSGCPKQMIGKLCFRSNANIPEFLSTHPSDVMRIRNIEGWLPDVLPLYQPELDDAEREGLPPTPFSLPQRLYSEPLYHETD